MLKYPKQSEKVKLVFLFITVGNRPYCFALFNSIFPTDRAPQHYRRDGYNIILENQMGYIQKIFLINIFIRIFHYIKQLSACPFLLAPLTCAGTVHSKGKAIAHVLFIPVTWMFVPQISYLEEDEEKNVRTSLASAVEYIMPYLSCTIKKTNLVILRKLKYTMMHLLLAREKSENLTTSLTILFQSMSLQKQADCANTFL